MGEQFLFTGPAAEVEAQHLVGALGRFLARPQADEQAGDQRQVHLDFHPVGRGAQQVPAAQDAFEPAKKQFRLPAIMPPKRDAYIGLHRRPHRHLRRTEDVRVLIVVTGFGFGQLRQDGFIRPTARARS